MSDGTGTSIYSLDSLNRLISSKDGSGATVGYGYDLSGNLTTLTYPGSHQVLRTFDQDSRMASVADWLGNTEKFAYDPNSNLTTTTFPASTKEVDTQAFDAADNLLSIVDTKGKGSQEHQSQTHESGDQASQTLASFFYTRDGNNQVTSETNGKTGDQSGDQQGNSDSKAGKNYTYTPLNQLSNVNKASYSYDPADNLVKLINGTAQTFDAANQLLSSVSPGHQDHLQQGDHTGDAQGSSAVTTTYSYDSNGNRVGATTGATSTSYSFDQVNRLVNFNNSATYSYNGDGLRVSKKIGTTTQRFTWDLAEGLPLTLSDSQNQYVYGPGGLPIEQVSSSARISFFHHDQLGSTRLLTDASGQVQATFTFDPYGNLLPGNGTSRGEDTNHAHPATVTTPFLFAGQYLDSESGLYYLRTRYYDCSTAQSLTVDPAASSTRAAYAYVSGNPLNLTDPTGLRRTSDPSGISSGRPASWCANPALPGDSSATLPCILASQAADSCPSGSLADKLECQGSIFYGDYFLARALMRLYHAGQLPLTALQQEQFVVNQVIGLWGDAYVDNLKAHLLSNGESPCDEQGPIHIFTIAGHRVNLPFGPGIGPDGLAHIEGFSGPETIPLSAFHYI